MFKIIFYIKMGLAVFVLSIFNVSFASSWLTINDLKESISMLQEKQKEILVNNPDLSNIADIKQFLKNDLTDAQISEINKIIYEYNLFKENNSNLENYQSQLLLIKKDTYKKLTSYVKEEMLNQYLEYIKNNLETVKKDIYIREEINKKQDILEAKVDAIKEKIKTNKNEIENNLNDIIKEKIDEKIKIIRENKEFKALTVEKRKYVIEQIIKKVELKKDEKIKSGNQIKEIEFYVYDLVIEKLKIFLTELK